MPADYPWDINELAASIAIFSHASVKSDRGGAALRDAMIQLQHPPEIAQQTLDRLGVEVTDQDGALLPLIDIVEQLHAIDPEHSDYWKIFGIKTGATMAVLVRSGPEPLRNLSQAVATSEDRDFLLADTRRLVGVMTTGNHQDEPKEVDI